MGWVRLPHPRRSPTRRSAHRPRPRICAPARCPRMVKSSTSCLDTTSTYMPTRIRCSTNRLGRGGRSVAWRSGRQARTVSDSTPLVVREDLTVDRTSGLTAQFASLIDFVSGALVFASHIFKRSPVGQRSYGVSSSGECHASLTRPLQVQTETTHDAARFLGGPSNCPHQARYGPQECSGDPCSRWWQCRYRQNCSCNVHRGDDFGLDTTRCYCCWDL